MNYDNIALIRNISARTHEIELSTHHYRYEHLSFPMLGLYIAGGLMITAGLVSVICIFIMVCCGGWIFGDAQELWA